MAVKPAAPAVTAPYGSWPSPLKAAEVAAGAIRRSEPRVCGELVLWAERRPTDEGRTTIVYTHLRAPGLSESAHSHRHDVPGTSQADISTRVHEYGGGAWIALPLSASATPRAPGTSATPRVLGASATDRQRLWLFDQHGARPVTPEPPASGSFRYADPACVPGTDTTVWVREVHTLSSTRTNVENQIVSVQLDGTVAVLAAGADFYASPQPSPDGTRLAFISWDHPNMPWDSTRLHVVPFAVGAPDGALGGVVLEGAALQQPLWSPNSKLHVVTDINGYWDIAQITMESSDTRDTTNTDTRTDTNAGTRDTTNADIRTDTRTSTALIERPEWATEVEFGVPSWVFANQTYSWIPGSDDTLWCTWIDHGVGHIGLITDHSTTSHSTTDHPTTGGESTLTEVHSGFTEFGRLEATTEGNVITVASSWVTSAAVVEISPDGSHRVLSEPAPASSLPVEAIAVPEAIEFATTTTTTDGLASSDDSGTAHGFYFPPTSTTHQGPADERAPLLVLSHGGPTGSARSSLDLSIQYWTSRGIGVVDVNYRGSAGYGTAYRNALRGEWGVADVADCVAVARHLSEKIADPSRLVIKGGSAGGYTTLCALVDTDTFAAGLTRYGVADLESLTQDTHKFEAHYLDSLIGPWPEASELYRRRSPLYRSELLRTPMLVLQGDQDLVVPPTQSEQLVAALAKAGVPHSYLLFEGEAHGFRQYRSIVAALEAELSFLSQVLGFALAEAIDPVQVHRPK